jgi:hypothetical protein
MKPDSTLIAWWLDELDEEEAHEVEAHLFECEQCGARLRELLHLGDAVRRALLEGHVAGPVSGRFIDRLREDGLHLREYRLEAGGSVACTVAPDDDLLISYLRAPLEGVRQLDAVFDDHTGTHRARHIPFDAAANEVAFIAPTALLKTWGVAQQRVRLLAVTQGAERVIAEYTFNHSPWAGQAG